MENVNNVNKKQQIINWCKKKSYVKVLLENYCAYIELYNVLKNTTYCAYTYTYRHV